MVIENIVARAYLCNRCHACVVAGWLGQAEDDGLHFLMEGEVLPRRCEAGAK